MTTDSPPTTRKEHDMPAQSEPRITVTPAHVETALRSWLAHFDYDRHKATECGEEDGLDHYPDEAAEFFAALAEEAGQQATPIEEQPAAIRVQVFAEAADVVDQVATQMRECDGTWPEEWSSREVRDAVQSAATAVRAHAATEALA